MVRMGTKLIVEVSGTAGSWWDPRDAFVTINGIVADVRAGLLPFVYVDAITIDDRGITDVGEWDYRAQLTVRPKSDYGDVDDIAAIVAHQFYEATGALPSATIGAGTQPPLEPNTDPLNPIKKLLGGLQQTSTLLIVGVVAIVGLVAFSGAVKVKAAL